MPIGKPMQAELHYRFRLSTCKHNCLKVGALLGFPQVHNQMEHRFDLFCHFYLSRSLAFFLSIY